ncbi:beta-propeller fold lactonase family protein [Aliiglaciecola litoralis]|uniref:Lactonase, 7-bladed beta-propeller n=1 Tax=Aliiglaciecola litoralis TaxID=582857 RepID=A0ABP3WRV9_9ALTE
MNRLTTVALLSIFILLSFSPHHRADAEGFKLRQALFDGVNGVDGLDNPRQVRVSPDGSYVWVTSADDNSILILELDEFLTPIQIFKSKKSLDSETELKLEGATGLALLDGGTSAIVASFYDSALSSFKKDDQSRFIRSQIITDNLEYELVFKSDKSLSDIDDLGILGAWGVSVSSDEQQLFVASYKSDAISIFDININSQLTFNSKINSNDLSPNMLGKPVSVVYSQVNKELVVAGFEGNVLNIFSQDEHGKFTHKQMINNSENTQNLLVNPQYLALSSDSKFIYVACSGSSAVLVFKRTDEGYVFMQSITQSETHGSGLEGVATLALSSDGSNLYAAGEFDKGVLQFKISDDGSLDFEDKIHAEANKIEGVTSIALSEDGKHMLLSLGKKDALYLLKKNE